MSSVSAVNSLLGSTSTTAPAVNVSSILASATGATTPGIDVTAAVAAGVYAARAPERIWQGQQDTLTSQTTALTAIQTAVAALATDMTSLNSVVGPLSARSVTSSNSSVVTATAASGTVAGSHTIAVSKLATTASWYSDLASSATGSLPSSTFTITSKTGVTATLSTGTGAINSLKDLAAAINAATGSGGQSLGVTANVVTDSTGARLAIISKTSGSAADFSIAAQPVTASTWDSASVAAHDTPLGADTFTLTTGAAGSTVATPITVTAGQSFDDVAATINGKGLGVTASVVSDASGAHLNIVSNDANAFTMTESGFGYQQAFAGSDATLTVDGVPVTSASNKVTGAISGVTLNLTGTTAATTPVNLTVASDAAQVSTAINQFVSDYNTAVGLVNAQFQKGTGGASQGVLGSDPTVRTLQNTLMQAMSFVNTPAAGATTSVRSLSDLGISMGGDGTLSIDNAGLNSALVNSATDVQNFFQGTAQNGFAHALTQQVSSFTNPGSGAFSVELRSISNTASDLTKHISDFESIYIANQQTILTAMYSKAEIALQQLPTELAQINAQLGNNNSK